jgi:hypothetical protein
MIRQCPQCKNIILGADVTCATCERSDSLGVLPTPPALELDPDPMPEQDCESTIEENDVVEYIPLDQTSFPSIPADGGAFVKEETPTAVDIRGGKETDLLGLVGAYVVIGGYSAAIIGLFTPIILILAYSFSSDGIAEWILFIFLIGVLGSIVWVPVSVIIAIIVGVGGLLLGLGVGIVAAVLYRLTYKNSEAYRVSRVLVAVLNAALFAFVAVRLYINSFLYDIFSDISLMPSIFGVIGGLSGLLMALISPEKAEETESLSDEEMAGATRLFAAPFRLWKSVAGSTSGYTVDLIDDALQSYSDPNHPEFQKREMERLSKELDRQIREEERQRKKIEDEIKRMQKGDYPHFK